MTTYETTAVPGQLQPPAPLDPQAVHELARHALDVLMPAATGPRDQTEALGEAAGQLAIGLCAFARLVEADADDQLAEGEGVVERMRRASLHIHEHMVSAVPAAELEARNTGLVDSNLEEGLPVVGLLSVELLLAGGRSATVRLTKDTAHQEVELSDGRTARLPAADHLIVRDGLHDLARLLAPLTGIGALTVDRLFCWPDARTAIEETRRALGPAGKPQEAQGEGHGGFFEPEHNYETQDGYTAPEAAWQFDCRHVTTTPEGDEIAFGFVKVGYAEWTPTGLGRADWDGKPWRAAAPSRRP